MIQVIQLGMPASEITLPTLARSLSSFDYETVSIAGRAADGTRHEDFIAIKREWSILYSVLSETNLATIFSIWELQFTNTQFLSLLITDQSNTQSAFTVRMSAPQAGSLIQRDVYYYNNVSFTLEEV